MVFLCVLRGWSDDRLTGDRLRECARQMLRLMLIMYKIISGAMVVVVSIRRVTLHSNTR